MLAALRSNPVVYVNGPRQAGKSTLVRSLALEEFSADYVTLHNATQMAVKTLLPFSAAEGNGEYGNFLVRLFENRVGTGHVTRRSASPIREVEEAISRATFPPVVQADHETRAAWFDGYLSTIILQDMRSLAEIEKATVMPRLLHALASRVGSLLNNGSIARDVGLNPVTGKNCRMLRNALFLTFDVSPYCQSIGKRLVKSAKGFITDTMLLCHLLGRIPAELRDTCPDLYGHVVENFVATELRKQLSWMAGKSAQLLHFRSGDNREVDFVLERTDGSLAAIEVKTADLVRFSDFAGLRALKELAPDSFRYGVVLYSGDQVVPFGEDLFAVPLSDLWLAPRGLTKPWAVLGRRQQRTFPSRNHLRMSA